MKIIAAKNGQEAPLSASALRIDARLTYMYIDESCKHSVVVQK